MHGNADRVGPGRVDWLGAHRGALRRFRALRPIGAGLRGCGAISLPIGDRFTHPSFAPSSPASSIDVGVLRVTALAPGVTPIPILAPEVESLKVTVGAGVVYVGYGMRRPGAAASGSGPNTERVSLAKTIAQVGGDRFESTYVSGGPCHGDEGGPALVTFGGRDALVATSWFMTQDCMGRAVSLRAHVFAPWVASLITTERTRLGAYGSADGVVASTTVGGIEDASAAVTLPDAATSSGDGGASTGGSSAVGADGQRGSVLMGAAEPVTSTLRLTTPARTSLSLARARVPYPDPPSPTRSRSGPPLPWCSGSPVAGCLADGLSRGGDEAPPAGSIVRSARSCGPWWARPMDPTTGPHGFPSFRRGWFRGADAPPTPATLVYPLHRGGA
ncbi:MAG: hypothetical protein U0235_13235 [Polyangiaceae bacterium]